MLGDCVKIQVEILVFKGKLLVSSSETGKEQKKKMDFENLIAREVRK